MENTTTDPTTPSNPPYLWVGEPRQRGTFGIILFCLSTLITCTWSALHFNVPTKRYSHIRRSLFHAAWMIFALFAPEALLFLAINERVDAEILLRKVLEFHPHLEEPGFRNWIRVTSKTGFCNWICELVTPKAGFCNWIRRLVACSWIRGLGKSKEVSAQCQAFVVY